jgi:hypothetical protein
MKLLLLLSLSWSLFLAYTRAELAFRSGEGDEPPSPCPGFQQTNTTYFNVSITPDDYKITVRFMSTGIPASTSNVYLSLTLFEDGEQVITALGPMKTNGDPAPLDMAGAYFVPEQHDVEALEALPSTKNITAQLWVYGTPLGGQYGRMECVQTRLRSDDASGGASNSTSSTGVGAPSAHGNSTSDGNASEGASHEELGNPTSDGNASDGASGEDSATSVPHVAFSLVM